MERGDGRTVRRILLVGFMGSGKSTVGTALAALIGWTFLDIDEAVSEAVGLRVSEIFAAHGEAFFREREHEATLAALRLDRHVLASGGGWPAAAGRLRGLDAGTASVFLEVSQAELERRLRSDAAVRPLLEGADTARRVSELLEHRSPYYRQARLTVDGEGEPQAVAHSIARALFQDQVELGIEPIRTEPTS